ncbi:hypothetical protein JAB6_29410 [Janthinobacterium sp. HH104]|uniref:UvrD-helicase domain-containing protein n=1 Tax=Janthinobacterium sp. HH104 TaxID=1537276 RepID=UPI000893DB28|nr:UvrD-helicase domain-containing protein [Janthinobacterium sp. HH104]OEZ83364.1 hypothetical protein JAB6_29410 [Janthinobacterium sp. HH104]
MNIPFFTLTLDLQAIENVLIGRTDLSAFLEQGDTPTSDGFSKTVILDGNIFVMGRNLLKNTGYLTVLLNSTGPIFGLSANLRVDAFERLLRVARTAITLNGAIPVYWRPYHVGKFISFQSNSRTSGEDARIVIDTNAINERHVYAFALDRNRLGLAENDLDADALLLAADLIAQVADAVEQPRSDIMELNGALRLSSSLLDRETNPLSYTEWYDGRLTKEQRKFVDSELTQSMRLVGPAGSGKTVALAIKALKELKSAQIAGKPLRALFLTHAMTTATLVEDLVDTMDPSGHFLLHGEGQTSFEITTIFALANRHMHYDLEGLQPLSLDGTEGRNLQYELLDSIIQDFNESDWRAFRSACAPSFIKNVEATQNSTAYKLFVWELMNEFACVLDADGIRSSRDRKKHYLDEQRKSWMMPLTNREEREVVLELYSRFRGELKQMKTLGVDQMIADYLNWLDSNRWEALREDKGYDVVFVDELHLFNRQERTVFRHLMRDINTMPVVIMAYDAKQSPRDTFAGLHSSDQSSDYWKDAKLGRTEKYELVDVFRYTPQIAAALACIDKCFPGQNLDDDWPAYNGISKLADGPVPTLTEIGNSRELFDKIFPRAKELQRRLPPKKRVAVLCASNHLFSTYSSAGKYKDDFVLISSREDLPKLKTTSKRYILSTPEFVAGLQFDTVLLIEANEDEVPDLSFRASAQRKFVSVLYLGASRAEQGLEIYATKEHGGPTQLLQLALQQGAIEQKKFDDLH